MRLYRSQTRIYVCLYVNRDSASCLISGIIKLGNIQHRSIRRAGIGFWAVVNSPTQLLWGSVESHAAFVGVSNPISLPKISGIWIRKADTLSIFLFGQQTQTTNHMRFRCTYRVCLFRCTYRVYLFNMFYQYYKLYTKLTRPHLRIDEVVLPIEGWTATGGSDSTLHLWLSCC